jgi:hypothetical protein
MYSQYTDTTLFIYWLAPIYLYLTGTVLVTCWVLLSSPPAGAATKLTD